MKYVVVIYQPCGFQEPEIEALKASDSEALGDKVEVLLFVEKGLRWGGSLLDILDVFVFHPPMERIAGNEILDLCDDPRIRNRGG